MTVKTPARAAAETAARRLGFTTMETQNSDRLDFKEVSIARLLQEIEMAYLKGYDAGQIDAEANA